MVLMISDLLKPAVTRVITPMAKGLLRMGLTPNSMTVLGGLGVLLSTFTLIPTRHFFVGSLIITLFTYLMERGREFLIRAQVHGALSWTLRSTG
jgi:CDP-diacylglycerol--glycerol-3-phosphate 3-phosphatidyltransferase